MFAILCIYWDTLSEKTGLWQLPIVSSVFKIISIEVKEPTKGRKTESVLCLNL